MDFCTPPSACKEGTGGFEDNSILISLSNDAHHDAHHDHDDDHDD